MPDDAVNIETRGGLAIMAVRSPMLTNLEAGQFLRSMRAYHQRTGCNRFVIEMSSVDFIDSACIGSLVTFLVELKQQGGRLMLAGCQRTVEDLFRITGLTTHIKLLPTVEAAEAEAA